MLSSKHYHESNDSSPSTGLRCLVGFQDKGKSRSCDLLGELVEKESMLRLSLIPLRDVKRKGPTV